jgi:transcriptional regulator with XRE-family HTH domain
MTRRRGLTHDAFVRDSIARDPELAVLYDEARSETELGYAIAEFREQRGMTQRALAEASGIAQPMINRIERGAQSPTVPTLRKLLAALHATLEVGGDHITVRPTGTVAESAPTATAVQDIGGPAEGLEANGEPLNATPPVPSAPEEIVSQAK